jgi:DNA repair photolyase
MTRMFNIVSETWNPITGCPHNCIYCWARKWAETKLKNTERYKNGFISRINEDEFSRRFNGGIVFVSDMGDMFAETVLDDWIVRVLDYVRNFPTTKFLFLTKNPRRYHEFLDLFPRNSMLGATVETDDDSLATEVSRAPPPSDRLEAMYLLKWDKKFISIEPIMEFTDYFPLKIAEIKPLMVFVGYDNYRNRLPEPSLQRTMWLMDELERRGIEVRRKTIRPAWYEVI